MKNILAITIIAILAVACGNSDKVKGYDYTENGLGYKFHRQNDTGKLAVFGSGAYGFIEVRTLNGELVFKIADSTNGQPIPFKVEDYADTADLFEGIATMREGDSATFVIKASTYYSAANDYPEGITPDDKLLVDISLVKVYTPEELAAEANNRPTIDQQTLDSIRATKWENEVQMMADYFEQEGIDDYQTLPSGVKYAITKKGNGKKVTTGSEVKADFLLLVLGTNVPVMSTVQAGQPYVFKSAGDVKYGDLPGLHDVITKLSVGDEAIITIPFDRAFGEQRISDEIPPFSTLVGTIKILSVKE